MDLDDWILPCNPPTNADGTQDDDPRLSCLGLPLSLPYEVETLAEMDDRLEVICTKIIECIKAREWGHGFRVWDAALNSWLSMGYPMKKQMKIKLLFLYWEILSVVPTVPSAILEDVGNQVTNFLGDRNLNIYDFRIPWRPLYDALYQELFPHPNKLKRHSPNLSTMFLNVAESAQRFFHPGDVDEMLEVILPTLEPDMDSILATQAFLVHFLPITHCQKWLPLIFRLWQGFNSGLWDDQASDLMGQLAINHVDPGRSDPSFIERIPRGIFNTPEEEANSPNHNRILRSHKARLLDVAGEIVEDDDGLDYYAKESLLPPEINMADPNWPGIRKDIGIFTEREFEFLMSKCLRSLNVPVGGALASQNAMSITQADQRTSRKILDAKKPIDRVQSLAETIIYSISEDAPLLPPSGTDISGTSTPLPSEAERRYLGGSKALDHLRSLLTSCESYFHPSNSGDWSAFLNAFLTHLAGNFLERWKNEQAPNCKTPQEWRLTSTIKREFVLCLRPLALSAMFDKDNRSAGPAVSALKKLAVLEPDLIMPALMERATPSLQGLEETHRTTAVTYALAALSQPFSARQLWRMGGMFVADIFTLLLPGIDLNDPSKTTLACMAISSIVDFICVGDISEVEREEYEKVTPGVRALRKVEMIKTEDDPDDPASFEIEDLSPDDVDERIRMATAAFRDWVPEFIGRVLLLFSNLPEEGGSSGRAGGKLEEVVIQSVLHTCGNVFGALSPKLFDAALEQIFEYASTTCRPNAVGAVGDLVRNLAAIDAKKTMDKFLPMCHTRIINELKGGASSMRTTTTSIPLPSDAALHWWQAILCGLLIPGHIELSDPAYRSQILELLRAMVQSTFSERGYSWTGKLIESCMICLTAIKTEEVGMLNRDEVQSDDYNLNHTQYWGKLYRAVEVQLSWRVPSASDVLMAFDIMAIADEAAERLDELSKQNGLGDKVWTNDFCRAISVVDRVLRGSSTFVAEHQDMKTGGLPVESYLPSELTTVPKPFKAGHVLSDPDDPQFQKALAWRTRIGEMLFRVASALQNAGDSDSSVETTRAIVTTLGNYLTAYGMRSKYYSTSQTAYSTLVALKRLFESQRKHHRTVHVKAAIVHHQNRLASLTYWRRRSELDDRLIRCMLAFCLSPFVRIRRSAQSQLDSITRVYRGCWALCFPALFDALKPGTDPDTMKGALYVLRYNIVGISRIGRDWKDLPRLAEYLLQAHHENKTSVQALVSKATDELIVRMKEPSSIRLDVNTEAMDKAADELVSLFEGDHKPNEETVEKVKKALIEVDKEQDEQVDKFTDRVLEIIKDPTLNWKYALQGGRFLLAMSRKDKPVDVRLTRYFMEGVMNPHPRIRDYGFFGTTRLLFSLALRSLCPTPKQLLLQEPLDALSKTIELTDTSEEFSKRYLSSFREPLPEDPTQAQLQDRTTTGWFVWGKTMEVVRLNGWEEQSWIIDPSSKEALEVVNEIVNKPGLWQSVADYWAQEDNRKYPSSTHIDFVLCIAQIVGISLFHSIQMDRTKVYDRHKVRAMWEFLAGFLRGLEEWTGKERAEFWEWLTPRLRELYGMIRHDTVKCWDSSIEYVLNDKDPRRHKPLVDFCINTALSADFASGSAFDLTRRVNLVRSLLRCFTWRFNAWSDDFIDLYFRSVSCPYADVSYIILMRKDTTDIQFHPSYPSVKTFVDDVLGDPGYEKDIMQIKSGRFEPQLREIMDSLPKWKLERPHGPQAVLSTHDTSALTILMWLTTELLDVHAAAVFPYIIPLLPEIFELRDLNDNPDLQRCATRLLGMITSITPSLDLIEPLMASLIDIMQTSTVSSWRTRINAMPILSLFYFRNLSLLSETCKAKCLEVASMCLRDTTQEVREMASTTLSGFLRVSQRPMVVVLKDRFTREIKSSSLPKRRGPPGQVNPEYQAKLVQLHGAVLGATALVDAFPYTVPKFMPKLLAEVLAPRVSEPPPISTTIRECVANFKRTHEKYQDKFTEDELSAMNYAQAGNSYCQ
ncbi:hypothetical protein TREMEDRAFT_35609 [Tremella mesenterica DSM 1558]|uniref:uncharacterized protein n=1 Tax=Tremella mesenterica (strain ATCC 24925 / CBS 8224 / DSM 1558 / NBRC 9311 / NRRL Y-6157 / RJB 2259-6 / UBC 559-6) TaxID=578456 RepID=UPI00032C3327|nr:uncharacterized protein TREMEDRAFT_35609 [Tremella mesenterica DSM 1558]EIW66071.1 hypothetical protein TREMEDRAFT_35609 [Tremella mesenterica DSM 1558]